MVDARHVSWRRDPQPGFLKVRQKASVLAAEQVYRQFSADALGLMLRRINVT
jgi:hypothetical protein